MPYAIPYAVPYVGIQAYVLLTWPRWILHICGFQTDIDSIESRVRHMSVGQRLADAGEVREVFL